MVDSISSNIPAPIAGTASEPRPVRPEPAVQVTKAADANNQGDLANQQYGAGAQRHAADNADDPFAEVNAAMEAWATSMKFELDEDTQQMVVSVIDSESGEVLRQIPSEEVLHVAKMIAQFQGKNVSTKA